ncbi:MAG: DUF2062 domain-containing protein [Qingshengfaniella sp.]
MLQTVSSVLYPRGGWSRAASYVYHRLRRLPDPPRRIARGVACGVFVSFSPLFGFHFVYAALLAWIFRGNAIAAMLSTFAGNPLTFPFIAATSLAIGDRILGTQSALSVPHVFTAFTRATNQMTANLFNMVMGNPTHWDRLAAFYEDVFLPYLLGGILPGLVGAAVSYVLAYRGAEVYKRRRVRRLEKRLAAKMSAGVPGSGKDGKIG